VSRWWGLGLGCGGRCVALWADVQVPSPLSSLHSTGCASTTDLTALQYRLSILESLLAESGIIAPDTLDDLIAHHSTSASSSTHRRKLSTTTNTANSVQPVVIGTSVTAAGVPKPEPGGYGPGPSALGSADRQRDVEVDSDTEGAALTLEHLAFGQRKTGGQGPALIPTRSHSGTMTANRNNNSTIIPAAMDMGGGRRESRTALGDALFQDSKDLNQLRPLPGFRSSFDASITGAVGQQDRLTRMESSLGPRQGHVHDNLHVNPTMVSSSSKPSTVHTDILNSLDPAEVFSLFYQRSDVYVRALLSVLPSRQRGELLVRQYLDRVEWLHRCESVGVLVPVR
jgi:hypothetical protein